MNMNKWAITLSGFIMLILILEPNAVSDGGALGLEICIKTVIPSLFPFFVFSSILSNSMQGQSVKWLRPIGRLMGIPRGSEVLVLLGLCGGYPVGAKCLADTYSAKRISKHDAQRMLCFCNNAGPSFIFGISASIFQSHFIPWVLWLVQIISTLIVAFILPDKSMGSCIPSRSVKRNPMEQTLKAMATVCGWIILMRVIICLVNNWVKLPESNVLFIVMTGILELSNGCIELSKLSEPVLRYVIMGLFLSFGGICVILQTKSLIGDLNIKFYILGKLLHTALTSALLWMTIPFIFPGNTFLPELIGSILISTFLLALIRHRSKNNAGNYSLYAV